MRLLCFLTLLFSLPAFAQSTLDNVRKRGFVQCGVKHVMVQNRSRPQLRYFVLQQPQTGRAGVAGRRGQGDRPRSYAIQEGRQLARKNEFRPVRTDIAHRGFCERESAVPSSNVAVAEKVDHVRALSAERITHP